MWFFPNITTVLRHSSSDSNEFLVRRYLVKSCSYAQNADPWAVSTYVYQMPGLYAILSCINEVNARRPSVMMPGFPADFTSTNERVIRMKKSGVGHGRKKRYSDVRRWELQKNVMTNNWYRWNKRHLNHREIIYARSRKTIRFTDNLRANSKDLWWNNPMI